MEEMNVVNATPEIVVESQQPSEVVESVNTEVATVQPTEDKPTQSKEENAKFAEIRRKYEAEKTEAIQKAKDDLIARQYGESHGIYTEAQYNQALEEAKKQEAIQAIQEGKSYSDDEAREIYEARQIKADQAKAAEEAKTKAQMEEVKQKDINKFLAYFERENGRAYDSVKDEIPKEVWESVNKGETLKEAYIEYQLAQFKQGQAVANKNKENSEAAIGSVKGDGVLDNDYISSSEFESKKSDQRWVIKNLDKINKSRLKW
jgi:hypothetical protein